MKSFIIACLFVVMVFVAYANTACDQSGYEACKSAGMPVPPAPDDYPAPESQCGDKPEANALTYLNDESFYYYLGKLEQWENCYDEWQEKVRINSENYQNAVSNYYTDLDTWNENASIREASCKEEFDC